MQICLISKYPPIQGGVSRDTFWMARALADNGIGVHVVTNANEVEDEFRIFDLDNYAPELGLVRPPSNPNVTLHSTNIDTDMFHIPWANPFVSKLASKAADIVSEHRCELIHAYYLEPYGVAAYLASTLTKTPFGLQHAGSDIGRLYQNPQLTRSYQSIISVADYLVLSPQMRTLAHRADLDMGVLYPLPSAPSPSAYFNPEVAPLDVKALLRTIRGSFAMTSSLGDIYASFANKSFDTSRPSIGVYNKLSQSKGLSELLSALSILKRSGVGFNFLVLGQHRRKRLEEFQTNIREFGLEDRTFLFPFIPHWHVPRFINACDVICMLENRFPIHFHTPFIPQEVLACGTCLLMSTEIAEKQWFSDRISNGDNCFVANPADPSALASTLREAISDRERTRLIGLKGRDDFHRPDDTETYGVKLSTQFMRIIKETRERRAFASMNVGISIMNELGARQDLQLRTLDQTVDELKLAYKRDRAPYIIKRAQQVFKNTFRLWNEEMRSYFYDFYNNDATTNNAEVNEFLKRFGDYLLEHVPTNLSCDAYAVDLIRYEKHLFQLKCHGPSSQLRPRVSVGVRPDDRPLLSEEVDLVEVEHDVTGILDSVSNVPGDKPNASDFHIGRSWLVFRPAYSNDVEPEVLQVGEAAKAVLELCNGNNSASDIAKKTADLLCLTDIDDKIYEVIAGLLENGCIQLMTKEEPSENDIVEQLKEQIVDQMADQDFGPAKPTERGLIRLCAKIYPKRVISIVMCKNADNAIFLLREDNEDYLLEYRVISEGYGERAIIDELNYYVFVEQQRQTADPIRREIVQGLVNKFTGGR